MELLVQSVEFTVPVKERSTIILVNNGCIYSHPYVGHNNSMDKIKRNWKTSIDLAIEGFILIT